MNRQGNAPNLRASQPGNSNALRHGAFSRRTLEPRAMKRHAAVIVAVLFAVLALAVGSIWAATINETPRNDTLRGGARASRGATLPLVAEVGPPTR